MAEREEARVLRIGVVHDGHLVLERRFRKAEDVTVGSSKKCVLQLPGSSVPEIFPLFTYAHGDYSLHISSGMTGAMSQDDQVVTLDSLKASGKAAYAGDEWVLPLRERDRGKVTLGDVELLFQVVVPTRATRRAGLRCPWILWH